MKSKLIRCPACAGTGEVNEDWRHRKKKLVKCKTCQGKGEVIKPNARQMKTKYSRKMMTYLCSYCGREKEVPESVYKRKKKSEFKFCDKICYGNFRRGKGRNFNGR